MYHLMNCGSKSKTNKLSLEKIEKYFVSHNRKGFIRIVQVSMKRNYEPRTSFSSSIIDTQGTVLIEQVSIGVESCRLSQSDSCPSILESELN